MSVERYFNTTGPIVPARHYFVPPLTRVDLDEIRQLVGQARFFVLHAPRQSGKTTVLRALQLTLNETGRYRCAYVSCQKGQAAAEDAGAAMRGILAELAEDAEVALGDSFVEEIWPGILERAGPDAALQRVLSRWAATGPKPLVALLDEIDALHQRTLVSVLAQLRTGYVKRPHPFPQSIVLCGMRNVRDYDMSSSPDHRGSGASPFNVVAKSLRLGDFSKAEVSELLGQHTIETGQAFSDETIEYIWQQTRGQPWLVNALGYEACFEETAGRNRSRAVTLEAVREARERLILRRETHIEQLGRRLQEPRVRRVVEPLLVGGSMRATRSGDIEYARDLGILAQSPPPAFANPFYQEVIPRELTSEIQEEISVSPQWYVGSNERLLMAKLLNDFGDFFRRIAEHWDERFSFKEAGPHLLLQAFLQRIVNSGGRIEREAAMGSGRADLLVVWPRHGRVSAAAEEQRILIECKVSRGSRVRIRREGAAQIRRYMDRASASEGHLVIFDRTKGSQWAERIYHEEIEGDPPVTVWGL